METTELSNSTKYEIEKAAAKAALALIQAATSVALNHMQMASASIGSAMAAADAHMASQMLPPAPASENQQTT